MNLKKKKKGFTLIELMAVIAIIAILAAVLVPTVTGYINRSKKTAVITQARNVVSAVETYNATASTDIDEDEEIPDILATVGVDLLSFDGVNKLSSDTPLYILREINTNTNSIKNITVNSNGVLESYIYGENNEKNFNGNGTPATSVN